MLKPLGKVLADDLAASPDRPQSRLVWRLALPVLAQNALGMFVGFTDTILAGQVLGDEIYLAAGAVAGYLLWFVETLGALIYSGSLAIVARQIGAGNRDEANRTIQQSIILAILIGGALTIGIWLAADLSASLMQLEGGSRDAVGLYLRIVAISAIPMTILSVGTTCLRAAGHVLPAMWIFLLVNFVNIVGSILFTTGAGLTSGMGWAGIAVGTTTSFFVGGVVTAWLLWRGYADIQLPRTGWSVDPDYMRRILRIGIPGGASNLVIVLCQLWFLSIIGRLGDQSTAAHGVAIRCESLSWLWGDAFGIAAATLVGQSLGIRRPKLAARYGMQAFWHATIMLSLLGVAFYFGADTLVVFFARPEAESVRQQGASVLRLVAFGMPALAASIVLTGALRGAGDTRGPFWYNTVGMLLFRIPLAYALTGGVMNLGLYGAWVAMVVDLYVRGILGAVRYTLGRWTTLEV